MKIVKYLIALIVLLFFFRGLFFEKETGFVIANETENIIDDFTVTIGSELVFNDTISQGTLPCCWFNKKLSFGFHEIVVASEKTGIYRKFKFFNFKNTHIFIEIWDSSVENEYEVEKRIYYFFFPMYA